jgi:hypothetical protein
MRPRAAIGAAANNNLKDPNFYLHLEVQNSLCVVIVAAGFGLLGGSFQSRYQHAVVVLTASVDIKFEYSNFRLFPDF